MRSYGLLLALALSTAVAAEGAKGPRVAPPPIGSRLSFTDWYLPGLRGDAEAAFAFASRNGLDGVEVNPEFDGRMPRLLASEDARRRYFDAQRKYGLRISSFCLGELWVDKLATDPSSVDRIEGLIDVCVLMKVPVILLPAFVDYDSAAATDTVVERLKAVAPRAERSGVVLGIENYLTVERNLAILKRVGSPAVRLYYDVGNSAQRGYDVGREIRMAGNRICQIHVKDYSGLFGQSKIDFLELKRALLDADYRGWLTLELEPGMVQPLSHEAGYKADAAYLRRLFSPGP